MRHISEGVLRRLVDEPRAVPDAAAQHLAGCARCDARRRQVERDAAVATAMLSRPLALPEIDAAWERQLEAGRLRDADHGNVTSRARVWRPVVISLPSPAAMVAVLAAVAAVTTAVVVSTGPGPQPPAAATGTPAAFTALADITGVGGGPGILGGLGAPTGEMTLPFGIVSWESAPASTVASIAAAEQRTGLRVPTPSRLPAGVGAVARVVVQPEVRATIRLGGSSGASIAGSQLTIDAGPAILVEYGGSASGLGIPTLATFVMARPSVSSVAADSRSLEAYVLSQPSLPPGLAQELRLLGSVAAVLPVAVPSGAEMSQVDVGGSPGILVSYPSAGASGVIWIDGAGEIHAALGLLDRKDILDVADQLG